jgi:hypothetical protein
VDVGVDKAGHGDLAGAVDLAEALKVKSRLAVLVAGNGGIAIALDAEIGFVDLGGEDVDQIDVADDEVHRLVATGGADDHLAWCAHASTLCACPPGS